MASQRKAKRSIPENRHPHLRAIPGGKGEAPLAELFSPTPSRTTPKKKHGRKQELPPIDFPKELSRYSDLFAAGKGILKEIEFKVKFAEQKLRDYCTETYVRLFNSLKHKPPSLDFQAPHSSFKFVQTHRTTLTTEKFDELRDLGIPIEDYTELSGIEINIAAIRQHKLEGKLREALASIGVSSGTIEECFRPRHELNPSFYDGLFTIVQDSLRDGESGEEKISRVFQILDPSSQIRNVETQLGPTKAFELVEKAEIEVDESGIE